MMEYRGSADVDQFARTDAEVLFRFLQRHGLIEGDPEPLPPLATSARSAACCGTLRASVAGIIAHSKALGEIVKKGDMMWN